MPDEKKFVPEKWDEEIAQVEAVLYQAQEMKISNQDEYNEAADFIKQANTTISIIEAKRKRYTVPLDDMKKGMDAMVQVMAAIAQAFGATLPDAVKKYIAELNKIPTVPAPPGTGGTSTTSSAQPPPGAPHVPGMATGGVVKARPGGKLVRLGEGGQDEWVIPKDKMGGMMGGLQASSSPTIHINGSGLDQGQLLAVMKSALRNNHADLVREVTDAVNKRNGS